MVILKNFGLTFALLLGFALTASAQRVQQALGRGVVVVQNGSAVTVTWRRLAQEPEDASWNVYVKKNGAADFTLLNTTPLSNTNYKTTTSAIPTGSEVAVAMVTKDNDNSVEHALSKSFAFKPQPMRNIFVEINYETSGSPLKSENYTTKFIWPCDLNGDGEYDYVVSRNPIDGTRNYYVEGYLADGTFLWNIDLGVNEKPCDGQNDNMCAYDIDCDGYGELIVQTSDGTRFWDAQAGTWGKYLFGKDSADSDGDGITDYDTQSTRNPPRYMTVVDGMTGAEKASAEFLYDDAYNRTNKASLMGDEYNKHEAHVAVFYHDGVHPAICGEWLSRRASDKAHMYRNHAFAYDFDSNGKATNWHQLFKENIGGAEFHMIRIFDADGDGKDEMSSGAYVMDHDGKTLYNTGIAHGDRHRTSDIDPERPGLETFSIQQNAPDMLGMILYDAGTGEAIKKWYLPSVGDVGRGDCADVDQTHLGWEMYSTMDGYQMYDAKGNKIEGKTGTFPVESIWWDGALDRERLDSPDGNGFNAMVVDFANGRLFEMAKEAGWTVKSNYGTRADYWGDIIGDWREEVILNRFDGDVNVGFVGFSTDITTSIKNIYCLQEDPHYRMDCTTRGYYQSPNPGFYLGYDMPRPQLPPCMVADDKTDVFGIADGNATIAPRNGVKTVYAMPVKGQTLILDNAVEAGQTLWKSQQGTLAMNKANAAEPLLSQGKIIISEGVLHIDNCTLADVDLRARGTLAGNGEVDNLVIEGALNYEGCRLMPQGVITLNGNFTVNKPVFIEIANPGNDIVDVKGTLSMSKTLTFSFTSVPEEGEYVLLTCEKAYTSQLSKIAIRGLTGTPYEVKIEETGISLVVSTQREAQEGVVWTGAKNGTWDYKALNFAINGEPTYFVAGDGVVFNDDATRTTITLNDMMPVSTATFEGVKKAYTLNGTGGISGKTVVKSGKVTVKELNYDFELGKGTLVINNTNASTDNGIVLTDTATISIASGNAALKGKITGNGTMKKASAGQVNITYAGANSWKETILEAGTLAMGAWNTTIGTATSKIHVTGNSTVTVFNNNSTSQVPNFQNTIDIDEGKTLTFHAGQRCTIKGSLQGKGIYKIDCPYVRADIYTNTSQFEGTYDISASSQGRFVQAMNLAKATLKLTNGVYLAGYKAGSSNEQNYTHTIGTLTGNGTLGTGTWNVSAYVATSTPITVNGTLRLASPTLDVTALTKKALSAGDELQLFTINGSATVTGDVSVLPAVPGEGLQWDCSTLAANGTIRVAISDGIEDIAADAAGKEIITDLSGRRLSEVPASGVYIVRPASSEAGKGKKIRK